MQLHKDLREFVALLDANRVDYVVVGAFAVAYHGYPRYTGDLDILIRPSLENGARVVAVLTQFGFGSIGIEAKDLAIENNIVQLGFPPNRIDLITSISGVTFVEAWETSVQDDLAGVPARIIGKAALLRNKEAAGRPKDLGDADELRKVDAK